jgi:hypothetical protein
MFHRVVARSCSPLLSFADRRPRGAALVAAQARILRRIVGELRHLPVGRHFGLDALPRDARLMDAFRAQVPITGYGDHAALIARVAAGEAGVMFRGRALALAQTSGTTGSASAGERHIPQNAALLRHHAQGGAAALFRLLQATGSRVLDGKLMLLGGSTALVPNAAGIPVGDLSGIVATRVPRWLRPLYEPGLDIALESDWERKLDRIIVRCGDADIRLLSGIPSWCLMLFARLCAARGAAGARACWPGLAGFIHGGHAVAPFLPGLREHLPAGTRLLEVYPASEAFIAVGSRAWTLDEPGPPALDLLTDHGVFLEFLPQDGGTVVGPERLAADRVYRVVITTPGGLVRYQLGDLVLGVAPGQVRVAGRIKTRISVFGEHVEGLHLDAALVAACAATGAIASHYHVAPLLAAEDCGRGRHEWWVEFARPPADAGMFAEAIDRHLRRTVLDYDAHRAGGQLLAPALAVVPDGTFHRHLARAGKLGGQHKVPQAWSDRRIADALAGCREDR